MNARLTIEPQPGSAAMLESRYPHIVERLVTTWHDPDATDRLLNTILVDDRNNRNGLADEAFTELMFLSDLNWKRRHFNENGVQVSADGFSFGVK